MPARRLAALALLGGFVAVALAACAAPAVRFHERAAALGFQRTVIPGARFEHVVYWRSGRSPSPGLNIYVDGDGLPWTGGSPAADPTPHNPLVLELMALDPGPVAYLGRPCYHGLAEAPGCGPRLWTAARYSEAVVESLTAAGRRLLERSGSQEARWFGYSGGGALVMLVAPRVAATASVVTVAGNLDVAMWARLHAYTPLGESLDPAAGPALPPWIRQRHYAGQKDRAVPPEVVAGGPIPPGTLIVVPGFDHVCCWRDLWPSVLRDAVVGGGPTSRRPLRTRRARRRSRRPRGRRT